MRAPVLILALLGACTTSAGIFGEAVRLDVSARKAMGLAIDGDRLYAVAGHRVREYVAKLRPLQERHNAILYQLRATAPRI